MDIFCKIINNEIPSYTIYEDDIVKVFLDVNPNSTGHCLIVPKEHYQDFFDIDKEVLNHVLETAKVIANRLKKEKYAVDIICDGEEGLEIVLQYQLRRIVTFLKSLFEPYHMLLYQLCNHLLI